MSPAHTYSYQYSIIGVLGGIVAVGGAFVFGGNLLNSDKTKTADAPLTAQRPAPSPVAAAACGIASNTDPTLAWD